MPDRKPQFFLLALVPALLIGTAALVLSGLSGLLFLGKRKSGFGVTQD